jgi:glycosyltransferase involved in cell wall biosynthesis
MGARVESVMVVPEVSVVMPVYDPPLAMLDHAIQSILSQTLRDFEFLILDDGSPNPKTRLHLDLWAARDPRLRVFHEPHRGLTRTLNRGLRLARAPFIARQDADDWSEGDRLSSQAAYLHAHPEVALAGTDAQLHRADGKLLWRVHLPRTAAEVSEAFFKGNPFVHGSTMYRRELALAVGGYREQLPCSQDYDFFWRLTERAGAVNLDQALYHYRYSAGSVSAQRAADQAHVHRASRTLARARQRGETEDIPAALQAAAAVENRSGPLRASLKQADHLMLAGDFQSARKAYLRLLQSHPWSGLAWAKLARLAVFAAVPPAREASFR